MAKSKDKQNRGPDAFQGRLQKEFSWVVQNQGKVAGIIGLLLVIGLGVAGFQYYRESVEDEAQSIYFKAEQSYHKKIEDSRINSQPEVDQENPETSEISARQSLKNLDAEIAGFNEVIEKYPSTTAAQMAALQLSQIYSDQNREEEAIALLNKVNQTSDKSELLGALVLHRLGSMQAKAGDCESALKSFQVVVNSNDLVYLHAEAHLRMGLCYENLGNQDAARTAYRKANEADPDAGAGQAAEMYLRLLGGGES